MTSSYRFLVSDELFDMATQAIQAHSVETRRFESIADATGSAARRMLEQPCSAEAIGAMLQRLQVDGPNRIHLKLRDRGKADFEAAGDRLTEMHGDQLTAKQRFALLIGLMVQAGTNARGY